jgi:hypothetical protein
MKLTLLLADWAEVLNGKLYIMGGGWTETGPAPSPSALAAIIEVDWDETSIEHAARFTLVDGDERPVMVPTPTGHQPMLIEAKFTVGRPPLAKPGSSFNVPVAVNIGPLALQPGKIHVWRCAINDKMYGGATFMTRPAAPPELGSQHRT